MRQQQRFRRDFDRLVHHALGRVRDVADKTQSMTCADHLGTERGEPLVHDGAGLEIANVVGRVVHELYMPDAALMRFLKPFELGLEKVEPFHVGNDRGLSRFMGGFEIGCGKGAAQAMASDHLIHPSEALEMMAIELARLGGAHRGQNALRIPAKHGAVRHVGQACDRKRSRPHGVREVVVRRGFRRDPGLAAMGMHIDGNGFAQHIERLGGGLGRRQRLSSRALQHRRRASHRPRPAPCSTSSGAA